MLNGIWMAMIVLAFVGAVCTGRWTALSAAAADGARQAVETVLLQVHRSSQTLESIRSVFREQSTWILHVPSMRSDLIQL